MKIIKLTAEEIQALLSLIDSGIRYDGLKSCNNGAALLQKIEAAEEEVVEDE